MFFSINGKFSIREHSIPFHNLSTNGKESRPIYASVTPPTVTFVVTIVPITPMLWRTAHPLPATVEDVWKYNERDNFGVDPKIRLVFLLSRETDQGVFFFKNSSQLVMCHIKLQELFSIYFKSLCILHVCCGKRLEKLFINKINAINCGEELNNFLHLFNEYCRIMETIC